MPIKFRCPHCQQFLGISRARAGVMTDCPMCGRSIRVPLLDGSVPPVDEPQLNLGDRGLASALDKLAGLAAAQEDDTGGTTSGAESVEVMAPASPGPVALPEPIELPPVPVSRPIAPVPVSVRSPVTPDEPPAARPAGQVLASLAEAAPASVAGGHSGTGPAASGRWVFPLLTIALCGLSFVAGYIAGRNKGDTAVTDAPSPSIVPQPVPPVVPPAAAEPALTGRVSYVSRDGEVRPDAGARVLVIPEERSGTAKLAGEGFRSGAAEADVRLATASLRAMGGDFTTAAADGSYSVALPQAGVFQLLILSRYQPRREGAAPDPAAVQWLSMYFDRPAQVVGESSLHLSQYRYRGSGTSTRDQTFERQ